MDAPGFNPSLHPRDLVGRWAHVASGDQAAKKLAVATKPKPMPRGADGKELKSDWNFTGSKETQYHHRHIKPGQLDRARTLKDSQDEIYDLMHKGMTFDQAKAKILGEPVVRASSAGGTKLPPGRVANFLVGGRVVDSSEMPAQPLNAETLARHAEARKFENMDLAWPTRDEFPRMQDRDGKVNFIKAQYHGILDRKNLDATKDNPATPEAIAAHLGKPVDEVKTVLMNLEAQSVVYGNDTKGYYVNKTVGSARSGRDSSYARHNVKVRASSSGSMSLPNLPVDVIPLRRRGDVKAVIKEIEATGRTEENSAVRRTLNSARNIGDTLFAARDADGNIVAAAMVDITGGKRSRQYSMHELFKDADAPPKSGTLLMVEVAKAAKAENAELRVAGAVATARTFYEEMGGDFQGTNQPRRNAEGNVEPSGVFTSQSTIATWSTEARDALADGRPIPAQHYLIEGPMVKTNDERQWTNTWVEPPRRGSRR